MKRQMIDFGAYEEWSTSDEERPPLSWRLDRKASFSDWAIEVKVKGCADQCSTYHCHRVLLAVGPRSCTYFSKTFRSGFSETSEAISKLTLEASAAEAFPSFLDWLYTGNLVISTDTAVALLDLSNYLLCKPACILIHEFINKDISVATSPIYLREASIYASDKVLAAALGLCASSFDSVPLEAVLKLTPDLFVGVVQSANFCCLSETLSVRVANFLEAHREEANGDLLSSLTGSEVIPRIDSNVAIELLRFGLSYGVLDRDGLVGHGQQSTAKNANTTEAKEGVKSSLRERCLASMQADFRKLQSICIEGLPSDIVIDLLKGGLDTAISRLDAASKTLASRKRQERGSDPGWGPRKKVRNVIGFGTKQPRT